MAANGKASPELLALWYQALESEFGIEITPSDPLIEADLYTSRQQSGDPSLQEVRMVKMKDGKIWLVKKELNMEEVDAPAQP